MFSKTTTHLGTGGLPNRFPINSWSSAEALTVQIGPRPWHARKGRPRVLCKELHSNETSGLNSRHSLTPEVSRLAVRRVTVVGGQQSRRRQRSYHTKAAATYFDDEEQRIQEEENIEETGANVSADRVDAKIAAVEAPASVWLPFKDAPPPKDRKVSSEGRLRKLIGAVLSLPKYLLAWCAFRAQQIMQGNVLAKLTGIYLFSIPAILAGGVLYSWASGRNLFVGLLNAYGSLFKVPGITVIGEVNAVTSLVQNILWTVGTFTFAIVLGIITEDVVNFAQDVRKGSYSVVTSNHTLILYWTAQTIPLLRQIAICQEERQTDAYSKPVVVLAEREKEEMDAELRGALKGTRLQWFTRSGAPHCLDDLERAAAGQAASIIILDPGTQDAGKQQVAALIGSQAARATTQPRPFLKLKPQSVTIQTPENGSGAAAVAAAERIVDAAAQRTMLTNIAGRRDLGMLLAQSALHPGVASVYCSIVQQTRQNVEFYVKSFPRMAGWTYGQVRRSFLRSMLCGYFSEDGKLHINPSDDDVLGEEAAVFGLAHTGEEFQPEVDGREGAMIQSMPGSRAVAPRAGLTAGPPPKRLVVAWMGIGEFGDLADSLASFSPDGTQIIVVSAEKPVGFPEEGTKDGCTFKHIEGDPLDGTALSGARLEETNSIIIGTIGGDTPKEADATLLALIVQLQEVLVTAEQKKRRAPLHVLATVARPETIPLANYVIARLGKGMMTAELLKPEELVGGIMSQVAGHPYMARLLLAFLHAQQISLQPPHLYAVGDDAERPVSFGQVAEAARMRQETAIGYITRDGIMRLAPGASNLHRYAREDCIVVIAADAAERATNRRMK